MASSSFKILKEIKNGANIQDVSKALTYSQYFTSDLSIEIGYDFLVLKENNLVIKIHKNTAEVQYIGTNIIRKTFDYELSDLSNIWITYPISDSRLIKPFIATSRFYDNNLDLFYSKKVFFKKLSNHLFTNGDNRYYYFFESQGSFNCAMFEPRGVTFRDNILFRINEVDPHKSVHQLKQTFHRSYGQTIKNKGITNIIRSEINKRLPFKN